jgi:hypothetical protein
LQCADIIHIHPSADGVAIGKATFADFHHLTEAAQRRPAVAS